MLLNVCESVLGNLHVQKVSIGAVIYIIVLFYLNICTGDTLEDATSISRYYYNLLYHLYRRESIKALIIKKIII